MARVRRPSALVVIAVVFILALAAVWLARRSPVEPLRVMVLAPQIPAGANEELGLAGGWVADRELATLASLEGLAPLDPNQSGPGAPHSSLRRAPPPPTR